MNRINEPFNSQSANPRNVPRYHAQVKDYNPYAYIGYNSPEHLMLVTLDHIRQKIIALNAHDIVPTFSTPVFQWATKIRRSLLQHDLLDHIDDATLSEKITSLIIHKLPPYLSLIHI